MNRLASTPVPDAPAPAPSDERPLTAVVEAPPKAALVRGMSRSTTIMVALTTLASATNYASNLVFSRLLSPESYGDLTALLAFSVVAAVPTGAAQTVVAERIAVHLAKGETQRVRYLIRHAAAHIGLVALLGGLVYAASIPLIVDALELQAIGPALTLAPLLVLSFFMPTVFGILQGSERFIALGLLLLGIAASRIVFGVPWTVAGGGAGGALGGQAIGNLFALVVAALLVRPLLLRRGTGAATTGLKRRIDRRAISASAAFIAFALISNLDIILAKAFLPARDVGYYAALVTLEKVVIFLPGAVALVMVPNAARALHTEGSAARVLRVAALLVLGTTLLAAVPSAIAPEFVLRTMFGAEYTAAADGVLPIVIAGAGLALLYLLVVYTVAIQDRRWVTVLIGATVLQVVAILTFHESPTQIAFVQAGVILAALVANEVLFHPIVRTKALLLSR
jgi:O-antigen/teichoic acid export membrane protein